MTRKSSKQTKKMPSTKRSLWKKTRREPSRKALLSFARVGLLGTQFV